MYHGCIWQLYKHPRTWHSMAHKALSPHSLICPHKTQCTKRTNWRTYKFTVIHWYNNHIPTLAIYTKVQNTHTDVCIQIKNPNVTKQVYFYKTALYYYTWPDVPEEVLYISTLRIYNSGCVRSTGLKFGRRTHPSLLWYERNFQLNNLLTSEVITCYVHQMHV